MSARTRLTMLREGRQLMGVRGGSIGLATPRLPTYPDGFPPEVIEAFESAAGRPAICNRPLEGLRAIEEYGAEHVRAGALILYTSQDSVFQVAAHVDVVPRDELYRVCEAARSILTGRHAVGRVIARPFEGGPEGFRRTAGRRDYALPPPGPNYVDLLAEAGVAVVAVGKVGQVVSGRGVAARRTA